MTKSLTLFYYPDNASLIIRMALDLAELSYETHLVDRIRDAQKDPSYKAVNPLGLIPTLSTPDGPVFETAAILLWIADQKPGIVLPDISDPRRGAALTWLAYLSNTLHTGLRQLFYAHKYIAEAHIPAFHDGISTQVRRSFAQIDTLCADPSGPFNAHAPSALDTYLAALTRWAQLYPKDLPRDYAAVQTCPALMAHMRKFETHPVAVTAAKIEGLGAAPFSNPSYPE